MAESAGSLDGQSELIGQEPTKNPRFLVGFVLFKVLFMGFLPPFLEVNLLHFWG